jgi:hypothetical protein
MTRAAAQAFFARYRDAFDALDGDAVAGFYDLPCAISQAGATTVWSEREAVADNMRRLCALYRSRGYQRAEFELGHVEPMGEASGFVHVHWRIVCAGGEDQRFSTGYTLLRKHDWKIAHVSAWDEVKSQ